MDDGGWAKSQCLGLFHGSVHALVHGSVHAPSNVRGRKSIAYGQVLCLAQAGQTMSLMAS